MKPPWPAGLHTTDWLLFGIDAQNGRGNAGFHNLFLREFLYGGETCEEHRRLQEHTWLAQLQYAERFPCSWFQPSDWSCVLLWNNRRHVSQSLLTICFKNQIKQVQNENCQIEKHLELLGMCGLTCLIWLPIRKSNDMNHFDDIQANIGKSTKRCFRHCMSLTPT